MEIKKMEEKRKTETNLDTGNSSDCERMRIGGWGREVRAGWTVAINS